MLRILKITSGDPHHDIYTFCYWQIFWRSIWHIFWHRPAVPTELGRPQVEVQQCPLSSEGPRLRSSGGPAVPTARGSWRRVGKAEVDIEVDAEVVEEKLEDKKEKEEEEEEEEKADEEEENNCDKI